MALKQKQTSSAFDLARGCRPYNDINHKLSLCACHNMYYGGLLILGRVPKDLNCYGAYAILALMPMAILPCDVRLIMLNLYDIYYRE